MFGVQPILDNQDIRQSPLCPYLLNGLPLINYHRRHHEQNLSDLFEKKRLGVFIFASPHILHKNDISVVVFTEKSPSKSQYWFMTTLKKS